MTVRVEWVPYGRPAARALRDAVRSAKDGEPLAPVSVVVPANHVGVATRRLLASGALGPVCDTASGVAGVSFLTVYRMAELLGSATLAAAGRRPVSMPVLGAAVRQVLAEDPGLFGPVAEHPATEAALVAAYRELRDLSEPALDRLAVPGGRAADVVRLHRSARQRLAPRWYDEEDLLAAAAAALGAGQAVAGLGSVVVYLPQRVSRHAAAFLAALADRTTLCVLAGTTGHERADVEVARAVRRLAGAEPGARPYSGAAAGVGASGHLRGVVSADRTRVLTASDADEEVRAAVRAVVDGARAGTPLARMAILHPGVPPYPRLVHEQLAAAGVPCNGAAVMPLRARAAGRTIVGLLDLPAGGFRREDLFAWLAGAALRHAGRRIPSAAWERLSRDAGVVAGRDDWDRLLATYAADCDAAASRAEDDPDAVSHRASRWRDDAARVRHLREFALATIDELASRAARPRPWSDHAAWAKRRLRALLGGGGEGNGSSWPVAERQAAERVERSLDRLAQLDGVEGPVPLRVFARALELELEDDLGRVGRMGEGVLVGSVGMGVGLDLDLVVVVGMAEGSLPAPTRDDSLLPDHEREVVGGELTLRADAVERQHRELLAVLAGANRHVLCAPRGDLRRSSQRVASRWLVEAAGVLAGEAVTADELLGAGWPWLVHVASFAAGLRGVAFPASEQEHRLRSLLAGPVPPPMPRHDRVLERAVEVVAARAGDRFTRFDGNLAGQRVPSPVEQTTSATRLERWADCPFAYFAREVLGVETVENPEDRLRLSPLDRGSLVHEVLERFVTEVLARPASAQPGPFEPWTPADRARLAAIAAAVCDRYETHGLTGRPLFWHRDRRRILAELERFLRADDEHRAASRTRPVAAELAFGLRGANLGAVEMVLPDGRRVSFRGKADRLDVGADGTIEVVDYKTGRPDGYRGLGPGDPDLQGTRLQLAVYGLAARLHQGAPEAPVRAHYWFTSDAGRFERIGYLLTSEVLARVSQTVARIVAGIERGVFPHHPRATSTSPFVDCPYCDPDGLGVVELRRRVARKGEDPGMAPFLDLVDDSRAGDGSELDRGPVGG